MLEKLNYFTSSENTFVKILDNQIENIEERKKPEKKEK